MSSIRPYKPDVAYADMNNIIDVMLRNLNDIARVINRQITADDIDFTGYIFPSTGGDAKEKNYFVKKWRINDKQIIPADEIYATTGIVFSGSGRLQIDGRLRQI